LLTQASTETRLNFATLQSRLLDNLRDERLYGPTEVTRSDKARIVTELNRLSLAETGRSFNDLCDPNRHPSQPSAEVSSRAAPQRPPVSGNPSVNVAALRQGLVDYFNLEELHDLCNDLGLDYEDLPGQGKSAKARELISYMQRRGRMADLLNRCQVLRPLVAWQSFIL
jgi:hypothetical protein